MTRNKAKIKAQITKLGKVQVHDISPRLRGILSHLYNDVYTEKGASLKALIEVSSELESLNIKETLTDIIYEMLQLLAVIQWDEVLWQDVEGEPTPRIILSPSYYDEDFKKNHYSSWVDTFIDGIASEDDFLERFILPYIPSIDKCKELVGKAKKGTLVYTDIPLIQKLESASKVNSDGIKYTENNKDFNRSDNIVRPEHFGNSQDYIFGRLKRDAELGDEKAQEVVEKVRRGEFKSARQVALEMGYRKPIKQKCLPMDVEKAVDKILKQMGEVYADELCTALYQRLREIHLQNSED